MVRSPIVLAAIAFPLACSAAASADDIRTVQREDGQTWQEVHRTIRHPVTEIQCVDQPHTVFQEHVDVQTYDQVRTYYVPVTEYQWHSYWRGRFNPLVQPYLAQRLVPVTRWEPRTEIVHIPVTRRQLVPVTTTVKVPITTQRIEEHDLVVSRWPVSGSTALAAVPTPATVAVGGVHKLEGDPPRRTPAGVPTSISSGSGSAANIANRGSQWTPSQRN